VHGNWATDNNALSQIDSEKVQILRKIDRHAVGQHVKKCHISIQTCTQFASCVAFH